MYLSQGPSVVAWEANSSRKSRVSPLFLCVCSPDAFLFSFLLSLHVTSVRLRSHAYASYRAAVCISSDVLLLTVFLPFILSLFSLSASNSP
ncbi:hypothetical protein BGY98DRAFT_964983 [Russula aff. rugulosa BPL654]|nr:hypothetical protein BGY98DRAFT_964983 [Russula aff. rugulosa BPL654]